MHGLDRRGDKKTAFAQLGKTLKAESWDLIFDLHQSLRSRWLLTCLKGPFYRFLPGVYCIDKRSLKRNLLLAFKLNLLKRFPSQREAYLTLLQKAYPHHTLHTHTELFPGPQDPDQVSSILAQAGANEKPLVALGAGASFALKRWPRENFLQLGLQLLAEGFQPLLLGGPGEEEAAWIAEATQGRIPNLAGKFTFLQTAACLARCRLAISNDSALVHFAEAMGTPALALFGPTVKEFGFGPHLATSQLLETTQSCRPCSRNGKGACKNREQLICLRELGVERVLLAALARLK